LDEYIKNGSGISHAPDGFKPAVYPVTEMIMFNQLWENSALGFEEAGYDQLTDSYTIIVKEVYTGWCAVFFGERFAYIVKKPNEKFYSDIHSFRMEPVRNACKYEK
jgi:hypothetical protein